MLCLPALSAKKHGGRRQSMARSVHLDGIQIRLYIFIFGFLGPLGLDSERFATPFLKCVSSSFSKKTNNPNPSPIKKLWFGLYWFGAGGGGRTRTSLRTRDFESRASANSTTPAYGGIIPRNFSFGKKKYSASGIPFLGEIWYYSFAYLCSQKRR